MELVSLNSLFWGIRILVRASYLVIYKNLALLPSFRHVHSHRCNHIQLWYAELFICVNPTFLLDGSWRRLGLLLLWRWRSDLLGNSTLFGVGPERGRAFRAFTAFITFTQANLISHSLCGRHVV